MQLFIFINISTDREVSQVIKLIDRLREEIWLS